MLRELSTDPLMVACAPHSADQSAYPLFSFFIFVVDTITVIPIICIFLIQYTGSSFSTQPCIWLPRGRQSRAAFRNSLLVFLTFVMEKPETSGEFWEFCEEGKRLVFKGIDKMFGQKQAQGRAEPLGTVYVWEGWGKGVRERINMTQRAL